MSSRVIYIWTPEVVTYIFSRFTDELMDSAATKAASRMDIGPRSNEYLMNICDRTIEMTDTRLEVDVHDEPWAFGGLWLEPQSGGRLGKAGQ